MHSEHPLGFDAGGRKGGTFLVITVPCPSSGDPAATLTDLDGDQGCRRTIMDGDPISSEMPGVRQDSALAAAQSGISPSM